MVGNWLGAALVAVGTAAVTGLLAMLFVILVKPTDFGLANTLGLATMLAGATWGADAHGQLLELYGSRASGDVYVGTFPLTLSLISGVVAVLLFRRVTRGYRSGVALVADAARTALLFAICLWVPSLFLNLDTKKLGQGWGYQVSAESTGLRMELGANSGGALAMGFLTMLLLLLLASLSRPGVWTGLMAAVHRWLVAPVKATAALLMLLPVAGAIGYAAILLFGDENDTSNLPEGGLRSLVASAIVYAGNAGVWLINLGVGSPINGRANLTGEGADGTSERLWGDMTEQEPGLWVAPAVALAVLLVVAIVTRRAHHRVLSTERPIEPPGQTSKLTRVGFGAHPGMAAALVAWPLSLLLVLPVLLRMASVHGSGQGGLGGDPTGSDLERLRFSAGPSLAQGTLLLFLLAAIIGIIVALRSDAVDAAALRQNIARAAATIQSSPGQHGGTGSASSPNQAPRGEHGPSPTFAYPPPPHDPQAAGATDNTSPPQPPPQPPQPPTTY